MRQFLVSVLLALSAALAGRAVVIHFHMSQFTRQAAAADEQMTAHNDSTADAGADRQKNDMTVTACCAITPFGQPGQVRIIANMGRDMEFCLQHGSQGQIIPTADIGSGGHHTRGGVNRTRCGDGYRKHLAIAVFVADSPADEVTREGVIAKVAKAISDAAADPNRAR